MSNRTGCEHGTARHGLTADRVLICPQCDYSKLQRHDTDTRTLKTSVSVQRSGELHES